MYIFFCRNCRQWGARALCGGSTRGKVKTPVNQRKFLIENLTDTVNLFLGMTVVVPVACVSQ